MHFESCKLMVYKPNYILLSRSGETGVLYLAIYHAVTSTFPRFMGQYLLEASPRGYSRGWYALDGRNRPYTAQDMLISVNGCPMANSCSFLYTMAKVDPLKRPRHQYHIIPSKKTYQRKKV